MKSSLPIRDKKEKKRPRKQNSNMALQESLDTVKLIQDTENSFNQTNYEEPLN